MWIVKLALSRPYTFIVVALLLLIVGPLSILRTPTDIFPNINIPVVSVVWAFNGLSAEEMEGRIVSTFERALTTTVNDIEHIESQSINGVAVIKVFFHPGAQIQTALSQVTGISQTLLRVLPAGITPPLILSYSASSVPILQLALSSKTLGEAQLFDLGNNFMRTQLATVQGASIPFPFGGKTRQVSVDIDAQALQAKGLAPLDVVNAINAQNLILPAGTAKIGTREYDVDINGSPSTIAALNDLPIKTVQDNTVYIRDVAYVHDGSSPQTNIVRHDGVRAALMTIQKTGSASTLDIVAKVKSLLPQIAATVPPALDIQLLADQSLFVSAAVQGVVREGVIAACLTGLMILLFLGSWRSTLIIAITIPLSVLTSITVLSALGETINIMTLGGLALAVGVLVDDATVAIENISQNREQGKSLETAILDGSAQIAVPTLVSTLSICIVFVPMFLLTGVARYLFVPLAEAVVFAMLASYFFSRTLIPTLSMYLLRKERVAEHPATGGGLFRRLHAGFERGFNRLRDGYHRLLLACMGRPLRFGASFLAICVLSLGLLAVLGRDFFPAVDAGQFKLHLRALTATRVEETARLCDLVEQSIRQTIPAQELTTILDNIGVPTSGINLSYSNSGIVGEMDADILVSLAPGHRPTEQYVEQLRLKLASQFPGISFSFLPADIVSQILNFGLPSPIDVQIVGRDVEGNRQLAMKLLEKLKHVDGMVDAHIQQPFDQPKLHVLVDRTRAQQVGFSQRDVASNLLISLSGSAQTSPTFWLDPTNRVSYQIATQTPQHQVDSLQALANIPVTTGSGGAKPQILGTLAAIERGTGQALVSHYNVQPVIDIFGSVQNRDLGAVADEVSRIVDDSRKDLPRGSNIVIRGQIQTMQSSFSGLLAGLVFAIVLVYLLMVVNFQSWLDPFIIITALPGALAGICWMLFLTHTTISVPALTGAIMSIGIATANSILVVSFARDQLRSGAEAFAAAVQAGVSRFRPVLMTALAMVIGMVPMALGLGDGGEQNAPLGRAVIGGLLFATVATLLFVPTVFAVIHSRRSRPSAAVSDAAVQPGPAIPEH
jgi:multidrug efflux pump subunit AcrB